METPVSRSALYGKLAGPLFRSLESATAFCKLRSNPWVELTHWLHQLRRIWRQQVTGAGLLPAGFWLWEILNVQRPSGSGCCCAGIIALRRYLPLAPVKLDISDVTK